MNIRPIYFIISLIVIAGFLLRFYSLGEYPVGLHRDEAFLGYNAYSILKTGRDMSGDFLPLHLKSFIYSPALYSYFSIPFIFLFDLSAFSVRMASAIFGSLTIILTFFLTRELFRKSAYLNQIAIISSFFISISPWHINLSRTATENIIVVFFVSLGVLLLLYWRRKFNIYFLALGFLCFFITLGIYQAPRAFLPIFLPILGILLLRRQKKKYYAQYFMLFLLLIILPLFFILSSSELSLRLRTVSIFAGTNTQIVINHHILQDGGNGFSPFISRFFHNKAFSYMDLFLTNYFKHFSFEFLFTDAGFPDRYRVPLVGLLYVFELPLVIIGMWKLYDKHKFEKNIIFLWVLIAPLGSALTFDDVPNLQRTFIIFPSISIISSIGFFYLILGLRKIKLLLYIIMFPVFLYFIFFYLHQYYYHAPFYRPWYRQDGYKDLVVKVNENMLVYKKAIITNRESAPTIFFLFYGKYDPKLFQKQTGALMITDFDRVGFGKYEFSEKECPLEIAELEDEKISRSLNKDVLYVNSSLCNDLLITNIDSIKRKDGSEAFKMVAVP